MLLLEFLDALLTHIYSKHCFKFLTLLLLSMLINTLLTHDNFLLQNLTRRLFYVLWFRIYLEIVQKVVTSHNLLWDISLVAITIELRLGFFWTPNFSSDILGHIWKRHNNNGIICFSMIISLSYTITIQPFYCSLDTLLQLKHILKWIITIECLLFFDPMIWFLHNGILWIHLYQAL